MYPASAFLDELMDSCTIEIVGKQELINLKKALLLQLGPLTKMIFPHISIYIVDILVLMDLKSKESPGFVWNHDMGPCKGLVNPSTARTRNYCRPSKRQLLKESLGSRKVVYHMQTPYCIYIDNST